MSDQSAYERNQRAAERQHDLNYDLRKRLMDASARDAQEGIKTTLLINARAAVAILAFISTLASRANFTFADLKTMMNSLYWFLGGIVFSGVTSGLAYLSNSFYAGSFFDKDVLWEHPYVRDNARSRREFQQARWLNWAGVILAYGSLGMFIAGVLVASRAMTNLLSLK